MSEEPQNLTPSLIRVDIDDIHHVRNALRRSLDKYQYLRLAVVMEELALSPYVTPRAMENGELDFDRQMILPLKENLKTLFIRLYKIKQTDQQPEILASGRIPMSEISIGGSLLMCPMTKNGKCVCEIALFIDVLATGGSMDVLTFYAPCFTTPLKEAALTVRRATKPVCRLCQCMAIGLFVLPIRTSCACALSIHHLITVMFQRSFDHSE